MKKTSVDIIILHKCTKNHDHMLYCSLDMARNRFNYFSFWAIFCPFTSLKAQKIKIQKNEKNKLGNIIILQKCTKNHDHMLHYSEIWHMTGVIIYHFGPFFAFLPS